MTSINTNANNTSATADNAVETIEVSTALFNKKRVVIGLGLTTLVLGGVYAYRVYKASKSIASIVTEEAPAAAEETPAEAV